MKTQCLKCARHHQQQGYKKCQDCYEVIWGLLIQNFSADLGLTEDQAEKLMKLSDEANRVLRGAAEMDLEPEEFAEYIAGKAVECKERLTGEINGMDVTV